MKMKAYETDHFGLRISQARHHEEICRSHVVACHRAILNLDEELARQGRSLLTLKAVNR